MKSTITFHGGAGSVTGANFLLDTGTAKILIDCGTQAQEQTCSSANFEAFAYDVRAIDALVITHAHADHIGRVPKLVRDGFRGKIYSTAATKDISAIMFEDALGIMQDESKKHGCDMLYEAEDVDRALSLWHGHSYHAQFSISDVEVAFHDAGHILGSATVSFSRGGKIAVFTGDLGNTPEPLLRDTEMPTGAHYIVMESVYGDRLHGDRSARKENLRAAIEEIRARTGTLLIPSFSIERTQVLLYELNSMVEDGSMQPIPIYLDSPLASRITPIFRTYAELLNPEARKQIAEGDDIFTFSGLSITKNKQDSQAIHREANPKVIIAGAGMSGGGRIRSHELEYLGDRNATVLFVGYQAPGTLGRRLQDGTKKVQIDEQWVRVHAQIDTLSGYSGHADRDQLVEYVEAAGDQLLEVFVTMGETRASLFLAQRLHDFLGVKSTVPKKNEVREIDF
jgi:metallo-beta-lactamase family protein